MKKIILLLFCAHAAMKLSAIAQPAKPLKIIDLTEYVSEYITDNSKYQVAIYPVEHAPEKYKDISLPQEKRYELKNGYTLIFRPVLIGTKLKPGIQTQLQKDNTLFILDTMSVFDRGRIPGEAGEKRLYDTRHLPRYQNVDFGDYFMLTFFNGGYRNILYEKKNGTKIFHYYGTVVADTDNDLLLYTEDKQIDSYIPKKIFLYDLKKQRKYFLNPHMDHVLKQVMHKEQCIVSVPLLSYEGNFKFAAVNKKYITIEFDGYAYGQYDPVADSVNDWQDGYPVSFTIER